MGDSGMLIGGGGSARIGGGLMAHAEVRPVQSPEAGPDDPCMWGEQGDLRSHLRQQQIPSHINAVEHHHIGGTHRGADELADALLAVDEAGRIDDQDRADLAEHGGQGGIVQLAGVGHAARLNHQAVGRVLLGHTEHLGAQVATHRAD